ncbi:PREDICTED: aminopeptidase B-like [Thamnophis sirtalis]|uniref:Aminopeptidase B-like n=1 Tax=Thamnophis sirtalis TaxID=35019 RepID=A0A6I9YSE1_9SAUR|nr:PREDICTED: aminopeptidase B-like [Thamnophis sirtalis]
MAAPETLPDVASASSAALFRLRHLRLGLDLRPEARALAGCLVLELRRLICLIYLLLFFFPSFYSFRQIWWLDPELTYGNSKPFVFTQGHSVCNRSFFPCFDTPAVKCTYSAVVKAPAGMQVLMSATRSNYEEEEGVYQFYMEYPIPAYLVALVAGDLVAAEVGPR